MAKTNDGNKKIYCKAVGCTNRGFWTENRSDGEILVKTNARHEGKNHIAEFGLAEMTVKRIRQDMRFAKKFRELLSN